MNNQIEVNFNDASLFTNVYWKLIKCDKRFVVSYGGAGSGKSVAHHQNELMNLLDADYDILIIRKHAVDIKDSCYELLKNIAKEWGISTLFHWRVSPRAIINKTTGHKIIFRGIDDPEKVKSIVGIKRILVEEASELEFEDFLELNRRARGIPGIQITFLLNPVSEKHWIKRTLIDSGNYSDKLDLIVSTYHDNPYMTDDDIEELERLKTIDENQYRIYVLAEWGIDDMTGKFAYEFNKGKHVGQCVYDGDEPLYVSFDFNVNPITCVAFQYYDDCIHVLDTIKLHNSNIYELCGVVRSKYPDAMLIVTGDASGKNASALVKDKLNYYSVIQTELGLAEAQFKVPTVNPPLVENRVLVNAVLNSMDIIINEDTNDGLIYDLQYVEVDENNKIKKDNRSDLKQQADALDCFRYYLNTFHREVVRLKLSYKEQ